MSYQVVETGNKNDQDLITFNEWSLPATTTDVSPILAKIRFQTVKYSNNCLYVWIGDSNCKLENISCAMKTSYSEQPLNTNLLLSSDHSAQISSDLALKLAKKLNKQVFVSVNIAFSAIYDSESQDLFIKTIQTALFNEIKQNPDKF